MGDYISRNNFDALLGESSEALPKEAFQRMDVRLSCMPFLPCFLQEKEREWRASAQHKTSLSVLDNPILALRRGRHEQALSFLSCEEKRRVNGCTGKAPRRVNA